MIRLIVSALAVGLLAAEASAQGPTDGFRRAPPNAAAGQRPQGRPPGPPPQIQRQPRPAGPPVVIRRPPPERFRPPPRPPVVIVPPRPPRYRAPPPAIYVPPPVYAPAPYAGPPPGWRHRRSYSWCQVKAQRLYEFEYRMQQDGRVSRDEARIAQALRADLANSCGGGRWAPSRGWYY